MVRVRWRGWCQISTTLYVDNVGVQRSQPLLRPRPCAFARDALLLLMSTPRSLPFHPNPAPPPPVAPPPPLWAPQADPAVPPPPLMMPPLASPAMTAASASSSCARPVLGVSSPLPVSLGALVAARAMPRSRYYLLPPNLAAPARSGHSGKIRGVEGGGSSVGAGP
jgi:hypothetical protein